MNKQHQGEIEARDRFLFGKNWTDFLNVLNDEQIRQAVQSLSDKLETTDLHGKRFLDIGSGSGLFSLAARKLGAKVHSFDFDPQSVSCTMELKRRHFPDDPDWLIEEGSVLDGDFCKSLGQWDIVYSWGVLHHTGAMWKALENIIPCVADNGTLFIAIYNDQGPYSTMWKIIKKTYNKLPGFVKPLYVVLINLLPELRSLLLNSLAGKPWLFFEKRITYSKAGNRGMSYWHDLVDWIGGYPFEVAKPEQIFNLYKNQGFQLQKLKTCAGDHGCNEFIFCK